MGGSESLPWCISGATEGQYKKREVKGTLGNLWVFPASRCMFLFISCHLCPVGLGKERPGFLSMGYKRQRTGWRLFLLSHQSTITFLWDSGSSLKQLPGERASSQESRAGRKPAGSSHLDEFSNPWGLAGSEEASAARELCFGSVGPSH